MVCVPAGEFTMGSSDAEIDAIMAECSACKREWFDIEKPQHTVYLDAFWIDQREVTNAQYRLCVDAGVCPRPPFWEDSGLNAADQPVVGVHWEDASAYCNWVGAQLPTEAEWEKAGRGTDARLYPWGNAFDGTRLNYCDSRCDRQEFRDPRYDDGFRTTAPVGSYTQGASPYGTLDMAGNAWEWVSDWYSVDYYAHSPAQDPRGPSSGSERVLRSGAWSTVQRWLRCANRYSAEPDRVRNSISFRCAAPGQ